MDRRGFFSWLSSLAAGTVASQPAAKPEPCVTPAYAGFDGSFLINTHSSRIFRACRCYADNPQRWGVVPGMMAVWRNRDDSVSKMVYRNRDGKLFDLQFVPMEEPT
jgi:hypothetical protein